MADEQPCNTCWFGAGSDAPHTCTAPGTCPCGRCRELRRGHDEVIVTETDDRITWTWRGEAGYALVQRQVGEALLEAVNDRARAREIAVQLEQENAHLINLVSLLGYDLREMHAAEAIDLDAWPAAKALTEWRPL